jgi:hypothetical protein
MYPSVDSTPESYGLPSTLDLAALYQLAQVSDPSSLGGSFCLSGTVAYGLPPWLQQTQNGFTIVLSPLEVGAKYLLSGSVSPQPVNLGGTAQITMNLTNTGSYPMRVVSASAQPDFESPINSNESLPLAIDAGQAGTVTFSLVIPNTTSVGQHQIIIGIGVAGLATYGWSSHIESKSILVDIAVTQPQPVATYPTTVVPSTTTMNASTATGICIPTTQTVVLISTTYTVPPTTVIQTYYATGPNGQLTTSTTSFTYTNTSFITAGQYGVQTINPCQQTNSETTTSNSNLPAPSGEALIGGFLVLVIAVLAVFIAVSFSNRGRKVKSTNAPPVTARDGRFFCISCGFENPSSNEFCGKCGNKLYPPV